MRTLVLCLAVAAIFFGLFLLINRTSHAVEGVLETQGQDLKQEKPAKSYPLATLAGGCFWCVESEFRAKDGILFTRVGYIGGDVQNPTYQQVTTGNTGHAEAVEIIYDPDKISYEAIIRFFLTKAHDPTQLNKQGVDVGPQYRSAIFYHTPEQKKTAQSLIEEINAQGLYEAPIVTELNPAGTFWEAETYHQQYYEKYEKQKGEIHPRVFFKRKLKQLKGGEE